MRLDLEQITSELNCPEDGCSIYFEEFELKGSEYNSLQTETYNPKKAYHPASLLKLFYSVYAKETILDKLEGASLMRKGGLLCSEEEILKAIDASLRISDNDALSYLVDITTSASSGAALDERPIEVFIGKRQETSKYFQEKGYSEKLSLANKCFSFGPYGRDAQVANQVKNTCTVEDIAKVMKEIFCSGTADENLSPLTNAMKRDFISDIASFENSGEFLSNIPEDSFEEYYQSLFIGIGLYKALKGKQLNFFSKAGWNSKVRHDAAFIVDSKNAKAYLLIVLTEGLSKQTSLIPNIAELILKRIK